MRELIERDYRIVMRKCPPRVKAFTVKNRAEDYYTIVIDPRLDAREQLKSYMHELLHMGRDDFDRNKNVEEAEIATHEED